MLTLLLACTAPSPDTDDTGDTATPVDLVASLVEPGPYRVGYRQSAVTYSDDVSTDRALRLALWFPTEETDGGEAAYLSGAIEAPDVLDDPAPAPGTHPVALFSHGHQAFAESSSFLAEHLASHGWVVASPDHTGNTTFDSADRDTEIYLQRPRDLSAVLDALPGELDVDVSAVPALGHSFGGYTVLAMAGATYDAATIAGCDDGTPFCSTMTPTLAAAFAQGARDPRVVAAVAMAAGDYRLFGADGVGAMEAPVLQMTGEMDPGDGDAYWSALDPDDAHRRLHVLGAGHQAFTDFSGVLEDGGTIEPEAGFAIIRAYALAAARASLGDAAVAPVLDGDEPVADAGVLSR